MGQRVRQTDGSQLCLMPCCHNTRTHARTRLTALFSGLPRWSGTRKVNKSGFQCTEGLPQKGKTNLDFTEARYSEWQWHQLGHMQVCTSLQTDNHASTLPLCFLQAGCPSCRPTNSVKALKANPAAVRRGHNNPADSTVHTVLDLCSCVK